MWLVVLFCASVLLFCNSTHHSGLIFLNINGIWHWLCFIAKILISNHETGYIYLTTLKKIRIFIATKIQDFIAVNITFVNSKLSRLDKNSTFLWMSAFISKKTVSVEIKFYIVIFEWWSSNLSSIWPERHIAFR